MRSDTPHYPIALTADVVETLPSYCRSRGPYVYGVLLAGVIGGLVCLPFVEVDVTFSAPGVVRAKAERVELRLPYGGRLEEVAVAENQYVQAGQVLLRLETDELNERLALVRGQRTRAEELLADLALLTANPIHSPEELSQSIAGPLGPPRKASRERQSSDEFRSVGQQRTMSSEVWMNGLAETCIQLRTAAMTAEVEALQVRFVRLILAQIQAESEWARIRKLGARGLVTEQNMENARTAMKQASAEIMLELRQALAGWQVRWWETRENVAALCAEEMRLEEERQRGVLCAPADGVVVGFTGWSPGAYVSAGEVLGALSPDSGLVVESWVSSADVVRIHLGQRVRMQVEAYPYTQWGLLEGVVREVGRDLIVTSAGQGGFRVLIELAATELNTPSGLVGRLGKGLAVAVRYQAARRTLLQLLYDDIGTWIDPANGTVAPAPFSGNPARE